MLFTIASIIGDSPATGESTAARVLSRLSILEGYVGVCAAAFVVALFATPVLRRIAVRNGVIDRPSDPRKVHSIPVAYLGGVAVYLGIMAGILYSLLATKFTWLVDFHPTKHVVEGEFVWPVPVSVMLGLTVIVVVGVIDDMAGISPRVKIGGQLFAAAALSIDDVGVRLASGLVIPLCRALHLPTGYTPEGIETFFLNIPAPFLESGHLALDINYWIGTAIIGIAVIGMCNAANLLDGLDGLLTGTTTISSFGVLIIALGLALVDDGPRDAQRIILCLAVIGACLGFLPHNFNPASIFLGDAGSLLLGFVVCVLILTLGDTGRTHLVAAGLIAFMLPILDTMLAIIRRKMEGRSVSSADDQHIHHMLRRAAGVRGAVFILYGIAAVFACAAAMVSFSRARMIYLIVLLLVSYIAVTAIKIARRRHIEQAAAACLSSDQPGIVGATISGPGLPLQQPGEAAAPPVQAPGSLSPLTTPPLPTTPAAT